MIFSKVIGQTVTLTLKANLINPSNQKMRFSAERLGNSIQYLSGNLKLKKKETSVHNLGTLFEGELQRTRYRVASSKR